MTLTPFLAEKREALFGLFRRYPVERVYAFGSSVSSAFDAERSDVDLIVHLGDLPPLERGRQLLALWEDLERLLERPVDLLTDRPIKNPYLRRSIEASKLLIYDRKGQEVPV
jgi:predicted nucleotidyltransferase